MVGTDTDSLPWEATAENQPNVYRRRRDNAAQNADSAGIPTEPTDPEQHEHRFQPHRISTQNSRFSWINRSLCSRGRKSISVSNELCLKSKQKEKSTKIARKKKRDQKLSSISETVPPEFVKEKVSYFEEVDSFELDEEDICFQYKSRNSCVSQNLLSGSKVFRRGTFNRLSEVLSAILQSPQTVLDSSTSASILIPPDSISCSKVKCQQQHEVTDKNGCRNERTNSVLQRKCSVQNDRIYSVGSLLEEFEKVKISNVQEGVDDEDSESEHQDSDDYESVLNLTPTLGEDEDFFSGYEKLLKVCGQSNPLNPKKAFTEFCDIENIVKIGEGTFGEAFKGNANVVFKIVPVDGDFLVNGEVQKTCLDLLGEVLLSKTLNSLRCNPDECLSENMCTNFIETKAIRLCQGKYEDFLLKAWEDWDEKHSSENEHPMIFPEKQLYVVFILEDGGKDLENFVLSTFDEARSLLVQVAASLAVAEVACEFEHRDLHWGNILLSRSENACENTSAEFIFQGKKLEVKTLGLSVSIIDFTLSRIKSDKQIFFADLSSDPGLFEGPRRDIQAETYRQMRNVTSGDWEGRYPKTNSLWLHYLADILLTKKAFTCSPKERRELTCFRRRALSYDSAQAALSDAIFKGMWLEPI